ncbi:MAG: multiheme c-type cytochrome [Gemmatimonadota bacterium]
MRRLSVVLLATGVVLVAGACEDDSAVDPHVDESASCIGCHTDYELLEQIATPDSVIPTGGCSGPPPYVEPHDRVFLEADGFAEFQASPHGELSCTACHNGVDDTSDKELAHSGDFVRRPSHENIESCASCHADMVSTFQKTLHFTGAGQKRSQILRAGVESFEQLHEEMQVGYSQNCASCHASCGDCHVNKPPAIGGGLADGHAFSAPTMRENCTACHASRGGHAYYGEDPSASPDVHLTQARFVCTDCHGAHALHGDGNQYEFRYQVESLPECTSCHTDLSGSNSFHRVHLNDLSCHTCHSQDYNNCASCHVGGEGARVGHYLDFKIAMNPLTDERPYRLAPVRRTLAAPDTWSNYGVPTLLDFDARPTYNYATPHNILLRTSRTDVGDGACYENCHIIQQEDGTYRNRELYLFRSDMMFEWELSPNEELFVDGHLPADWGTP